MKTVLIFPPQWNIFSPSTGIPELSGMLRQFGHDTKSYDLNIDFYNNILTSEYIKLSIDKAVYIADNPQNKYPQSKVQFVRDILKKHYMSFTKIVHNIEKSVRVLKNEEMFYNPILRKKSLKLIHYALFIVSLPYYPYSLKLNSFCNLSTQNRQTEFEFKNDIGNKNTDMFTEYYKSRIDEILSDKPDLIGISLNSNSQLFGCFSIAKLLKSRTNVHISIGGSLVETEYEKITKDKDLFENYVDSCMLGVSELTLLQLAEFIDGKRAIKDVSNLIYYDCGKKAINQNNCSKPQKVSFSDYTGYNFSQYFMPKPVLPIRVSHGCYWGKCYFCDYNSGKMYCPRSPEEIYNEIEKSVKKYNINLFYFQDAALQPDFTDKFSDLIIRNKLEIKYITNLRLEKQFDNKLLKKLYKSGLRVAQWGLETANQRVSDIMNKGLDVSYASVILKNAYNAGLYNHLYLMFDFPGETYEECKETTDFVIKYKKYIHSLFFQKFIMLKNSYISLHHAEFSDLNLVYDTDKKKSEIIDNAMNVILKEPQNRIIGPIQQMNLLLTDKYPIKFAPFYMLLLQVHEMFNVFSPGNIKIKNKNFRKSNGVSDYGDIQ